MKRLNHQQGAAVIVLVIFLALLSSLVLATIQSRLLLQINRNRSQSDALVTFYGVESELYDYAARLNQGYNVDLNPPPKKLANGTEVLVIGSSTGGTTSLEFTAKLPFAVNRLQLDIQPTVVGSYGKAEFLIALDCSASMNGKVPFDGPSSSPTRFDKLKEETINFLNEVKAKNNPQIKVGVIVFTGDAKWIQDAYPAGNELQLTSDMDLLISAINNGFGTDASGRVFDYTSPACQTVWGGTNVGEGFAAANAYFALTPPQADTKRSIVVITDGQTNTRLPNPQCPLRHNNIVQGIQEGCFYSDGTWESHDEVCFDGSPHNVNSWFGLTCGVNASANEPKPPAGRGNICYVPAEDYVRCNIATTDTPLPVLSHGGNTVYGTKPADVFSYLVRIYTHPDQLSNSGSTANMYESLGTPYIEKDIATQLAGTLSDIFGEEITGSPTFSIRRL